MLKHISTCCLIVVVGCVVLHCTSTPVLAQQTVVFVDANSTNTAAPSTSNPGNDWGNVAYKYLQNGLTRAGQLNPDDDTIILIRVRGAISSIDPPFPGLDYKPDVGSTFMPGVRNQSFKLRQFVHIEGGYIGGAGSDANTRDPKYVSILSGDIGTPGTVTDNSYHVVMADVAAMTAFDTFLDGVHVVDGYEDGSSDRGGAGIFIKNQAAPRIVNCTISDNTTGNPGISAGRYGGGICSDNASPVIIGCTIENNVAEAWNYGGGVVIHNGGYAALIACTIRDNKALIGAGVAVKEGSDADLVNCVIVKNEAVPDGHGTPSGGGVSIDRAGEVLAINCTITENEANDGGGWFQHRNCCAGSLIRNCIVYGNIATQHPQVHFENSQADTLNIDRSDIEGGYDEIGPNPPTIYTNNQDVDPLFVDAVNGNYRLACDSLCVDAGNPTASLIPQDTYNINAGMNGEPGTSEATPDRALHKRVGHSAVDQGAYERHNCYGDTNQSGVVDIDDILLLVNTWGSCPGGGAPCPADISPGVCGGDGLVNIDDLLQIVNFWGKDYRVTSCENAPTLDVGDFDSVQDCIDEASTRYEAWTPEWVSAVNTCSEALCLAEIIVCD